MFNPQFTGYRDSDGREYNGHATYRKPTKFERDLINSHFKKPQRFTEDGMDFTQPIN